MGFISGYKKHLSEPEFHRIKYWQRFISLQKLRSKTMNKGPQHKIVKTLNISHLKSITYYVKTDIE